MRKDYKKLFTYLDSPEPSSGLFDRIIFAIKQEQEKRQTRKIAYGFLALLVTSLSTAPLSWSFFSKQITESGILQFLSLAVRDFSTFTTIWPDSIMAIVESLPITGIIILVLNLILVVFTLRLFLFKKRVLLKYFTQNMAFHM